MRLVLVDLTACHVMREEKLLRMERSGCLTSSCRHAEPLNIYSRDQILNRQTFKAFPRC